MRAAACSIRPSSFGWTPSSIVMPDKSAAPANRSAGTLALATGEARAAVPPQHVERRAIEATHVLEQRAEVGLEVAEPWPAVHEYEPRAGRAHEAACLGSRHPELEQPASRPHAFVPIGGPRQCTHPHFAPRL